MSSALRARLNSGNSFSSARDPCEYRINRNLARADPSFLEGFSIADESTAQHLLLLFRGNAPRECPVGCVVPRGHDHDGQYVCDIAVHVENVELHIQDQHVQDQTDATDGVEFQKSFQALSDMVLMAHEF
jgi:hypothetical protein